MTSSLLDAAAVNTIGKSNVAVRQTSCQNSSNCYPANLTAAGLTVPSDQISCGLQRQCICSGNCFILNGSICGYSKCGWYAPNSGTCNSLKKSQTTAFLLSLFVSSLGVANFYIGQNELGGAQLAIFILTIAVSYMMCCLPCCLFCGGKRSEVKGSIIFIGGVCFIVMTILLCSFAMVGWWIADLVIFAQNERLDGNGCALEKNL
ncbi:hypothetical protein EMCRGX_G025758 [Ephydatia muelleri]